MDFIIKKLNSLIDVSDSGSLEKTTYLRERIEYSLFLILGYLWNKNIETISLEDKAKIIIDLKKISIGQVVNAIRILDVDGEIMSSKAARKLINAYPNIRNSKFGHAFTHGDKVHETEEEYKKMFDEFINKIELVKASVDFIIINKVSEYTYDGIRLSGNDGGLPKKWSCPKELIKKDDPMIDRVYINIDNSYYRISPFIMIKERGEDVFIFNSLVDKLSGNVKFCKLFKTGDYNSSFKELISISEEDSYRRISTNGTIMNYFDNNFSHYIEVGLKKIIVDFLKNNKSSVSATIWGHGGVGKTACIQEVCNDLFNEVAQEFMYIVFVTAKDRVYNTKTGKINKITNIQNFNEVILTIANVIFDVDTINLRKDEEIKTWESKITEFNNKLLIVIDDYETFSDIEKEKIVEFIKKLNVNYHKVIITTRNSRFVIGEPISMNELNGDQTKTFLTEVINHEYPEHKDYINSILNKSSILHKIHDGTSGRPIFIYQFAHLFAQHGYSENILNQLSSSNNAKEFLYGRIYDYLGETTKDMFVCISQVANDSDMMFRVDVIKYLVIKGKIQDDTFESSVSELENQRVIERYDDSYYRVYSQELYEIMLHNYKKRPQAFRDTVKNKLDSIGGSNIKGSIFDAMVNEADKSRGIGNEKETIEKYKRVLNAKDTPHSIKKQALINLSSYLRNDRLNPELAISIIQDYYQFFKNDIDINKIYVQLLWSIDEKSREKSTKLLRSFFNTNKKTDSRNLELFALAVSYISNTETQRYKRDGGNKEIEKNSLYRIFNEYGRELFEFVKKHKLNYFRPAVKHNIQFAFFQVIYLCIEIGKTDIDNSKLEYAKKICDYAKQNFSGTLLNRIERLDIRINNILKRKSISFPWWGEFKGKYKEGDVVQAIIVHVERYGAFAKIEEKYDAFIHISEIAKHFVANIFSELHEDQLINAKIIRIDDSLKQITLSAKSLI
ncbi:S1 RNA-binding domain-containing protein [Sporolactobacillus laevolacticus]|uniref:S1 RNA-binding domain-containing protein n=1 Tax=Sporolactobacillus laevolacticus TaxID=33018 RepID=UPI0025B5C269|nr:S1 RNA-binding domain-containing protein [Sporolactobacillus laevolacticus]MDN3955815.1 S1 RNA-binding domain-containing protein [Sporolactobacillus laevolacticus]